MHAKLSKLKQKMTRRPLAHDKQEEKSGKFFPLLASDCPGFLEHFSSFWHLSISNH
jgi:hypothetical protein